MNELLSEIRKSVDSGRIAMPELAERAAISLPYLYRLLNGQQSPTLPVAERLANAIGRKFRLSRLTAANR